MMLIASWTLWTPASSTTISFDPCFVTSGSLTPSLSIRFRITVTERSRAPGGSVLPGGGVARSTTSRPPWRSRPRVGFLCAGEPGIASTAAPARAATISPRRMRCDRRSATCTAGRLPGRFLRSRLVLGLGLLACLELALCLLVLLVLLRPHDAGDGAPGDAHVRPGRDLDEELVVGDALDMAEEAARGDDLVADLDVLDQRVLLRLAAPLRPDQEQPEEREEDHDDDEAGHDRNGTALRRWRLSGQDVRVPRTSVCTDRSTGRDELPAALSRARASSLNAVKAPFSIASRAPAVRSRRKRRLCRLSSRRPRSSCWFTRWRRYARVKRVHAGHVQPSSSGRGSRAKRAFRRWSRPARSRRGAGPAAAAPRAAVRPRGSSAGPPPRAGRAPSRGAGRGRRKS